MRSNSPCEITVDKTFDVVSASAPASATSLIKIAPFAPIESALRSDSLARSGPIEITVTVCGPPSSLPPCASTIRIASSMAYSSKSLRTASTLTRSSNPSTIFFSAHESGTCLIQTAIFMAHMLLMSNSKGQPNQLPTHPNPNASKKIRAVLPRASSRSPNPWRHRHRWWN